MTDPCPVHDEDRDGGALCTCDPTRTRLHAAREAARRGLAKARRALKESA